MRAYLALVILLSLSCTAAGPVIWGGKRSKVLTQDGFELKSGQLLDNDGKLNYVDNNHGEKNADGWSTYNDGASATPTDCTGGAVTNFTFIRSTNTPLVGDASLVVSKGAANRQGYGASYDFVVEKNNQGEPLAIQFNYNTSAAYASSDLRVYIYDVDNAALITPGEVSVPLFGTGTDGTGTWYVEWDSTDADDYRLCLHTATTNASAWDFKLDDIYVGRHDELATDTTRGSVPSWSEGTWASTVDNFTNLDAADDSQCNYFRIAQRVYIFCEVTVDPTTTNTDTRMDMTVPIARGSNFDTTGDASINFAYQTASGYGACRADTTTTDTIFCRWRPQHDDSRNFYMTGAYNLD